MLRYWLRTLFERRPQVSRRAARRLQLETLEDRVVPAFLSPVAYATGPATVAVAVGDFNGDGHQDVISLSNTSTGAVNVLLGRGDGTFQAAVGSPAGISPSTLTVGDFDGDGNLDAAVGGPSYLNILKGNGDGTFQAPVQYLLGGTPTHLESADFNNDGRADLVLSTVAYGGTAMVLMNHGDGTFAPAINLAANANPTDLQVGDVNHDGNEDLVIANQFSGSSVTVILGNGDGTFQSGRPYYSGSAPYKVALGDFNRDGNLDIVDLNSYTSNSATILLGNGDGSYQSPTSYYLGVNPNDIQVADFNGDGSLDLLEPTGAGYEVELGRGDGSFYTPSYYSTSTGTRSAVGDFNGDGVADIATASPAGGVIVMVNGTNAAATLAGATGLTISAPATVTAGQPIGVTVSAVDANGNLATGFTGTIAINVGSLAATQPFSYTFTAADGGTHTFNAANLTSFNAGVQPLTVTSPFLPSSATQVTVLAAAANHFTVQGPAATRAGDSASATVTAYDRYGNVATDYAGTVALSSSDVQAGLPAAYTFTAADGGVHSFVVTLKTAGAQTVTARDAGGVILGTSAAIQVTAADAVSLSVAGGGGFIGSAHTVTVAARDTYDNIATGYNGTTRLSSSDPNTTISGDVTLVNGVGTVQVTPMTLGTQTLSAVDLSTGTLVGSETVTVTPGWAASFVMTSLAATVAGVSQSFTVTAYDAFGNVSTVYTGGVLVATSDPRVGSFYYAFTAADAGVHTFTLALKTAGAQSVSVSDYADRTVTVGQSGIAVTPAAAASIAVTPLHGTTAGVAQSVTVTAYDAFGNVATGYAGTLAFTSSDTQAVLPTAYTFTAADAGKHTFNVTFKSAGGQTISVQDTTNAGNLAFAYSQRDIAITPAAMAGFSFRAPSNVTVGVAFNLTVQAVDAFGNVVPGYTGKVHFSGPSGVPLDYTFTAADAGVHVFSVTLSATGTQIIGVQDTLNGSFKGQTSVKVVTGTTSTGGGGGGGTATGGGGGTATGGGGGGGGGGGKVA
jgi:hypothetical protein